MGPRDNQEEGLGSAQVRQGGAGAGLYSRAGLWGLIPGPVLKFCWVGTDLPPGPIPSCCTHTPPGQASRLPWAPMFPAAVCGRTVEAY